VNFNRFNIFFEFLMISVVNKCQTCYSITFYKHNTSCVERTRLLKKPTCDNISLLFTIVNRLQYDIFFIYLCILTFINKNITYKFPRAFYFMHCEEKKIEKCLKFFTIILLFLFKIIILFLYVTPCIKEKEI
jgi:hypothetical protein